MTERHHTNKTNRTQRGALVFDFGERRLGVAFANPLAGTATELTTLPARAGVPEWRDVDELVAEWEPEMLVVGVPYNMDDSESPMTARAREFAAELSARYGLPVETMDERLTSAEASMILREQRRDGRRKRRVRRADVDRVAARLIAESWLRGVG